MNLNLSLLAAFLAFGLDLYGALSYIRGIRTGAIMPHLFSWLVWTSLMFIGGAICFSDGAVIGGAAVTMSATLATIICVLAYRRGTRKAAPSDWIAFLSAMGALPLWFATDQPLYAALIITAINVTSYYPTFRQAYRAPHGESVKSFGMFTLSSSLRFFATLAPGAAVALIYPASIATMNLCVVVYLLWRRRMIPAPVTE